LIEGQLLSDVPLIDLSPEQQIELRDEHVGTIVRSS
jgi:hypothetical protein